MGRLICFIGAPASGKSTLASAVHTELKMKGVNSIFVGEIATNYIAEYGLPNTPLDQMVVFYKQLNAERMFVKNKDVVICDSSSILNYFYFRSLYKSKLTDKDIAAINHIQKEILKSLSQWDHIFYVPPIPIQEASDGIRYHGKEEIEKIDRWIKSYLEMESISHEDLSRVPLDERVAHIVKLLS
jgi:thymidylate kinase